MSDWTFQNPVITGFYPDPSICRVGDDYYLVTSSFEYFPGVPILHSRDLVHWQQIGHCLTTPSQLPLDGSQSSHGIYAPTIRYANDRFFMVTTNVSNGGNFYVHTDDPAGPWSEPIYVDQGGIDPSLMFDEDGTVYFTSTGPAVGASSNGPGIYLCTLDIETGRRTSETKYIWTGTGGAYPEAPHLYHIGDWYYLLVAEGGTEYGHMVTVARSRAPFGPYESCPSNPILTHRSVRNRLQGTGHADMIQAHDGSWWMVFLAFRPQGSPPCYHLGRETCLTPITWTEDGWPAIPSVQPLPKELPAPSFGPRPGLAVAVRDDFNEATPGLCWNYLRSPDLAAYSLTDRPGWLRLHGAAASLEDVSTLTMLMQRQRHFHARAATRMEFAPQAANEEAGLTIRMNERHHYELFRTHREGQDRLVLRCRIDFLQKELADIPAPAGAVTLGIESDPFTYAFYVESDGNRTPIGQAQCRFLSTEVASGFTGVYYGLYATGNGKPCVQPADFDWFDYEPLSENGTET